MGVAREDLASLITGATAVEPGAHGCGPSIPSWAIARLPGCSPARGGRRSDAGTTREELYRSAVEAVACGTEGVVDSFERAGVACNGLVFSGGIVNNSLWQQVTVDVLGREVELVVGDNLTLRACAVIGATTTAWSAIWTKAPLCTRPGPRPSATTRPTTTSTARPTRTIAGLMMALDADHA